MSVFGLVPIGTILSWTKSFAGVATLAAQGRTEYLECNGQTIFDGASPLNGQVMPSLNSGQNRFLRGSATSGTTTGAATHTHSVTSTTTSISNGTGSPVNVVTAVTSPTGNNSVTPVVAAYDVVYILRIK